MPLNILLWIIPSFPLCHLSSDCKINHSRLIWVAPINWWLSMRTFTRMLWEMFQRVWSDLICCQDENENEAQIVGCNHDRGDGCPLRPCPLQPATSRMSLGDNSQKIPHQWSWEKENAKTHLLVATRGPNLGTPRISKLANPHHGIFSALSVWITPCGHRSKQAFNSSLAKLQNDHLQYDSQIFSKILGPTRCLHERMTIKQQSKSSAVWCKRTGLLINVKPVLKWLSVMT